MSRFPLIQVSRLAASWVMAALVFGNVYCVVAADVAMALTPDQKTRRTLKRLPRNVHA